MIRDYASDRVTCRAHESALISGLIFRPNEPHEYHWERLRGTVVETPYPVHFKIRPRALSAYKLRFVHTAFNEHNHPKQFGIKRIWPTLREQDETEAMGAEDTRLYPAGLPASAQPHGWGWL